MEHSSTDINGAATSQLSYAMTQFLQEHDRRRAFFAEGDSSKGKKCPELNEQTEQAKGSGGGGKDQTYGKCPSTTLTVRSIEKPDRPV